MLPQSEAMIFISAERQELQTKTYRSCRSLQAKAEGENSGYGDIISFEEVTIAGGETTVIGPRDGNYFTIIPLVGTLHFENRTDDNLINPGQALFVSTKTMITNPYPDQLVNFLQVSCFSGESVETEVGCFDIDNCKNQLVETGGRTGLPKISIGKFDGRKELQLDLGSKEQGVFVYVITGAFEVQYRLLEAKDSLFVWDAESLDLEALSNEAIILLIETRLTAHQV